MINKKTIEKLETPFYVINYSVLEKNYKELKKALEDNWNNYILLDILIRQILYLGLYNSLKVTIVILKWFQKMSMSWVNY